MDITEHKHLEEEHKIILEWQSGYCIIAAITSCDKHV